MPESRKKRQARAATNERREEEVRRNEAQAAAIEAAMQQAAKEEDEKAARALQEQPSGSGRGGIGPQGVGKNPLSFDGWRNVYLASEGNAELRKVVEDLAKLSTAAGQPVSGSSLMYRFPVTDGQSRVSLPSAPLVPFNVDDLVSAVSGETEEPSSKDVTRRQEARIGRTSRIDDDRVLAKEATFDRMATTLKAPPPAERHEDLSDLVRPGDAAGYSRTVATPTALTLYGETELYDPRNKDHNAGSRTQEGSRAASLSVRDSTLDDALADAGIQDWERWRRAAMQAERQNFRMATQWNQYGFGAPLIRVVPSKDRFKAIGWLIANSDDLGTFQIRPFTRRRFLDSIRDLGYDILRNVPPRASRLIGAMDVSSDDDLALIASRMSGQLLSPYVALRELIYSNSDDTPIESATARGKKYAELRAFLEAHQDPREVPKEEMAALRRRARAVANYANDYISLRNETGMPGNLTDLDVLNTLFSSFSGALYTWPRLAQRTKTSIEKMIEAAEPIDEDKKAVTSTHWIKGLRDPTSISESQRRALGQTIPYPFGPWNLETQLPDITTLYGPFHSDTALLERYREQRETLGTAGKGGSLGRAMLDLDYQPGVDTFLGDGANVQKGMAEPLFRNQFAAAADRVTQRLLPKDSSFFPSSVAPADDPKYDEGERRGQVLSPVPLGKEDLYPATEEDPHRGVVPPLLPIGPASSYPNDQLTYPGLAVPIANAKVFPPDAKTQEEKEEEAFKERRAYDLGNAVAALNTHIAEYRRAIAHPDDFSPNDVNNLRTRIEKAPTGVIQHLRRYYEINPRFNPLLNGPVYGFFRIKTGRGEPVTDYPPEGVYEWLPPPQPEKSPSPFPSPQSSKDATQAEEGSAVSSTAPAPQSASTPREKSDSTYSEPVFEPAETPIVRAQPVPKSASTSTEPIPRPPSPAPAANEEASADIPFQEATAQAEEGVPTTASRDEQYPIVNADGQPIPDATGSHLVSAYNVRNRVLQDLSDVPRSKISALNRSFWLELVNNASAASKKGKDIQEIKKVVPDDADLISIDKLREMLGQQGLVISNRRFNTLSHRYDKELLSLIRTEDPQVISVSKQLSRIPSANTTIKLGEDDSDIDDIDEDIPIYSMNRSDRIIGGRLLMSPVDNFSIIRPGLAVPQFQPRSKTPPMATLIARAGSPSDSHDVSKVSEVPEAPEAEGVANAVIEEPPVSAPPPPQPMHVVAPVSVPVGVPTVIGEPPMSAPVGVPTVIGEPPMSAPVAPPPIPVVAPVSAPITQPQIPVGPSNPEEAAIKAPRRPTPSYPQLPLLPESIIRPQPPAKASEQFAARQPTTVTPFGPKFTALPVYPLATTTIVTRARHLIPAGPKIRGSPPEEVEDVDPQMIFAPHLNYYINRTGRTIRPNPKNPAPVALEGEEDVEASEIGRPKVSREPLEAPSTAPQITEQIVSDRLPPTFRKMLDGIPSISSSSSSSSSSSIPRGGIAPRSGIELSSRTGDKASPSLWSEDSMPIARRRFSSSFSPPSSLSSPSTSPIPSRSPSRSSLSLSAYDFNLDSFGPPPAAGSQPYQAPVGQKHYSINRKYTPIKVADDPQFPPIIINRKENRPEEMPPKVYRITRPIGGSAGGKRSGDDTNGSVEQIYDQVGPKMDDLQAQYDFNRNLIQDYQSRLRHLETQRAGLADAFGELEPALQTTDRTSGANASRERIRHLVHLWNSDPTLFSGPESPVEQNKVPYHKNVGEDEGDEEGEDENEDEDETSVTVQERKMNEEVDEEEAHGPGPNLRMTPLLQSNYRATLRILDDQISQFRREISQRQTELANLERQGGALANWGNFRISHKVREKTGRDFDPGITGLKTAVSEFTKEAQDATKLTPEQARRVAQDDITKLALKQFQEELHTLRSNLIRQQEQNERTTQKMFEQQQRQLQAQQVYAGMGGGFMNTGAGFGYRFGRFDSLGRFRPTTLYDAAQRIYGQNQAILNSGYIKTLGASLKPGAMPPKQASSLRRKLKKKPSGSGKSIKRGRKATKKIPGQVKR